MIAPVATPIARTDQSFSTIKAKLHGGKRTTAATNGDTAPASNAVSRARRPRLIQKAAGTQIRFDKRITARPTTERLQVPETRRRPKTAITVAIRAEIRRKRNSSFRRVIGKALCAWVSGLTVGRSAASRASEASGPSEGEGGESAATPC